MGQFKLDGVDELMQQLTSMADMSKVAPKMINAVTPAVVKNLKKNIQSAANRGYATGELVEAVRATKAKANNYGYYAAVGVTGKDSKGVSNAEKLAYMEYGTQKQTAHPVMKKTKNESEQDSIKAMQEVFDAEVGR